MQQFYVVILDNVLEYCALWYFYYSVCGIKSIKKAWQLLFHGVTILGFIWLSLSIDSYVLKCLAYAVDVYKRQACRACRAGRYDERPHGRLPRRLRGLFRRLYFPALPKRLDRESPAQAILTLKNTVLISRERCFLCR